MRRAAVCVLRSATVALIALQLGTEALAQRSRDENIDLCNGKDRSSPDVQIEGCTAVLESGSEAPVTLAIAHNNRGNAYTAKQEYDHAIQDYDESIKLSADYAPAFNNRSTKRGSPLRHASHKGVAP